LSMKMSILAFNWSLLERMLEDDHRSMRAVPPFAVFEDTVIHALVAARADAQAALYRRAVPLYHGVAAHY